MILIITVVSFGLLFHETASHGMMLDPPNRSSLWRFDPKAPINYNDNQNFCGGAYVQNELNGGLCGVCGDNYSDAHPQDNENTGKYGQGTVVALYESGSILEANILLTANHLGTFNYSLCVLENHEAPEPGENCFQPLLLEDGSSNSTVFADVYVYVNRIQLPNITCDRCVFRWTYRAGNNWGFCEDGTTGLGCGPQEHFRSCADITII